MPLMCNGWRDKMENAAGGKHEENIVLCGANSYVEKYYFNEQFAGLPEGSRRNSILCAYSLRKM